jgi:hypothetical protein
VMSKWEEEEGARAGKRRKKGRCRYQPRRRKGWSQSSQSEPSLHLQDSVNATGLLHLHDMRYAARYEVAR